MVGRVAAVFTLFSVSPNSFFQLDLVDDMEFLFQSDMARCAFSTSPYISLACVGLLRQLTDSVKSLIANSIVCEPQCSFVLLIYSFKQ